MTSHNNSASHWDAHNYQNTAHYTQDYALQLLNRLNLTGNEFILDIGCGDGRITQEIAKSITHVNVIGIDNNSSMIKVAQEKKLKQSNLHFENMDAEKIQFPVFYQFDIVTSFYCMQWVSDKAIVFKRIKKYLRLGGSVAMLIPMMHHLLHDELPQKMLADKRWFKYFENYSDPTQCYRDIAYEKYLAQAYLVLDELKHQPATLYFANKHAITELFSAIIPYPDQLPTVQLKDKFISEFTDEYLRQVPPDHTGRCKIEALNISQLNSLTSKPLIICYQNLITHFLLSFSSSVKLQFARIAAWIFSRNEFTLFIIYIGIYSLAQNIFTLFINVTSSAIFRCL